MKKLRVLVSLCVVTLSVAVAPTAARAAEESGWYTKADVGVSFVQDIELHVTDIFGFQADKKYSFDPGVRVDLGIGYEFNKSWAVELNPAFIYNHAKIHDTRRFVGDPAPFEFDSSEAFYQLPIFINGIYTLPLEGRFKPYVGLGIGLELSGVSDLGGDIVAVGQFIAGVKYEVNDKIDVGIAYKVMGTTEQNWELFGDRGEGTWTHAIMATFTYKF